MEGAVISGRRAAMEVLQINNYVIKQEDVQPSRVDERSSRLVLIGAVAVALCAFYAVKNSKLFFKVK